MKIELTNQSKTYIMSTQTLSSTGLFYITIKGTSISWTKKLPITSGMRVAEAFLAYYGSQAGKREMAAINRGDYSLQSVSEDVFKKESRFCW